MKKSEPPKNKLGAAMFSKAKPQPKPVPKTALPVTPKAGVVVRQTTGGDDGS
jgi:hypothetical protein